MGLFQKTILRQYLLLQNEAAIKEAFVRFEAHFHNPKIQQEILHLKEEQYQEGFLRVLFVDILGYTLPAHPTLKPNLITELKNPTSDKKVDGAIMRADKALAVIELKSAKTVDLDKVVSQAFSYKYHHKGCQYVIISNFRRLRLYIEDATEYEEFDLFTLDYEHFRNFYLVLQADNLLKDLPTELRLKSITHRQEITLQFYNHYKQFKDVLFYDLTGLNKKQDILTLFEKAQRIADKIVFICFAQDRGLLPANYLYLILQECETRKEEGEETPLYALFVKHFGFINKGYKSKKYDIFGYNGGLFAPDSVADTLQITDTIFSNYALNLTKYDFETDIDVNVLGHIFEHSLKETDTMRAQLASQTKANALPKDTKRKVDGIFYTPIYITDYIIQETLGKLCAEKQTELEWENLTVGKLQAYRTWLLSVTVLDPACGSGAFLNQILNFFIQEHQRIDDLESYLSNTRISSDLRHHILENNIFGVDINAESVAITKLSLWLRIAEGKRKLNDLSNNIKRGNSLIDDASIDAFAFDWQKEFSQVFAKPDAGFTLVVGNPPWGAFLAQKEWLKKRFKNTSFGEINSYKYFVELATLLLKEKGVLGFILPDSYLEKDYFSDIRKLINETFSTIQNIRLGDNIFPEVNLPSSILIAHKKDTKMKGFLFTDLSKQNESAKISSLNNRDFIFDAQIPLIEKSFIAKNSLFRKGAYVPLIELYDQTMGVKVYQVGKGKPKQTGKELAENKFITNSKINTKHYPFIAQGIYRYFYDNKKEYINYGEWLAEARELRYFNVPKIVVREIMNSYIYATLIEQEAVVKNIAGVIIQKNLDYSLEYLLALLCSKLFAYCIKQESPKSNNQAFPSITSNTLKNLPIKELVFKDQQPFIDRTQKILAFYQQLHKDRQGFLDLMEGNFGKQDFSKKLENWYELDLNGFLTALEKQKIKLSLKQQKEWKTFFEEEKNSISQTLKSIQMLENEIDALVYALYDLSPEEVKIIENE